MSSDSQGRTGRALRVLFVGAIVGTFVGGLMGCPPEEQPKSCECGASDYDPEIDPANFVDEIDNPYFPLVPGTTFVYEADTDEGIEHIEVVVTDATKEILGVTCTVVHDTAMLEGDIIEDTYDWYAQDVDGNVWYFGEASMEFEDGMVVSTFGSWEAGVDCAKPGIVMLADPVVGEIYRQEFYQCIAEDMGEVLALGETITVELDTYDNCLRTHDFTPLDPEVDEEKLYAEGVGFILAVQDGERAEELVEIIVK